MAEATSEVSEPPVPFVKRLRSLCQHIDKNVALLKLDLSRPSGSTPFTHDRGLNAIKSDISELKKKCEELKPALESMNNFSNWSHSMQDLVNQQAEDVKKMEEYLIKFGYNPGPNPATKISITSAPKVEMVGKMSTSESSTVEIAMRGSFDSKANLVATSQSNKQSEVPLMPATSSKMVKDIHMMDTAEFQKTPLSSRTQGHYYLKQSAGRGSCYKPGHSTVVEDWLKGIENCMLELTPDVLRHKRAPVKQEKRDRTEGIPTITELPDIQGKPEISEESLCLMKMPGTPAQNSLNIANADRYVNTPVEPELSEFTIQCLNFKKFQIGKENEAPLAPSNTCSSQNGNVEGSLEASENCDQGKSTLLYGANKSYSSYNMKDCTPEEPVLSYQALATVGSHIESKTPEEPVLSAVTLDLSQSKQIELRELEEPVLSNHLAKYCTINEIEAKTPEEPVLSSQDIKSGTTIDVDSKTPEEPVLSYLDIKSGTTIDVDSKTPEEPVLSYLDIKSGTPEEPILSYRPMDNKSGTPEEPILSNQIIANKSVEPVLSLASSVHTSRNLQSHSMYNVDDMPMSPQLSEITMSLLSAANQGYLKYKSLNTEKKLKQDSFKASRNDAPLFGRNGREVSHRVPPSQLCDKASKENISLPGEVSFQDKKNWPHPGITFHKFVGGGDDDIPPPPELSETTQRLIARLY